MRKTLACQHRSTKEISAGSSAFNITSGTFTVNSSSNINLDTGNNHIVLKSDGTEFGRLTHNGGQLQLKSGANQVFLTGNNTDATFNNDLIIFLFCPFVLHTY